MYTIKRWLMVLAIVLFSTVFRGSSPTPLDLSKTLPIEKTLTVSELMASASSSDRFGLVDYFRKLKLNDKCKSPVLTVDDCKKLILDNTFNPCLCTAIYNVTKELMANFLNTSDMEIAKIDIALFKSEDSAIYENWKIVSGVSPSLKLFMDLLKEENWKRFCYNSINNNLTRYCKFLNFEILLWHNGLLKSNEPIKDINNVAENIKNIEPKVSNDSIPEEQKKIEILKLDAEEGDTRKNMNVDINDEELSGGNYNNKDEETTNEDNLQDKQIDSKKKIISSEPKLLDDTKSSNDYPNAVDGTINQSEAKEPQSRFSQGIKKTFTNHEFGDVEDSHFLFYFGIMTVLSMLFYLALYNKKKIIALLIEGRRSTNHRRRPNTASYSKVETDDGTTVF